MSQVLHGTAHDLVAETGIPVGGLTVADLFERYGPMPLSRVVFDPLPGTATEGDVERINERHDRLVELEDGILLEKALGAYESYVASVLVFLLGGFVREKDLGRMVGADGMAKLAPQLIRVPDVAFYSWERLPRDFRPGQAFFNKSPELAIEVISPGNTKKEMNRKLGDYFTAGVRLVWYVYPITREVHVYTAVDRCVVVGAIGTLDGGDVLPGFSLQVAQIFK